jgi:hypothetical protein
MKFCLTTQLPYNLYGPPHSYHTKFVSLHSYHTIFMSHHTVTIQTSHLTTWLPNFMFHHTADIQNTSYFQWLSHSNFMSIMHTKIIYPKLPNFKDLCTSKFSGLTNTSFLCCSSHDRHAGFTNGKAESSCS